MDADAERGEQEGSDDEVESAAVMAEGEYKRPVQTKVNLEKLERSISETPNIHRHETMDKIPGIKENKQLTCVIAGCTTRSSKHCTACSVKIDDSTTFHVLCTAHYPFHVAKQCYNAYLQWAAEYEEMKENSDDNNYDN